MPFDPGRMDDPTPTPLMQFKAQAELTEKEQRYLSDFLWGPLVLKFADWCYDQGFAEGMIEADTQREQGG